MTPAPADGAGPSLPALLRALPDPHLLVSLGGEIQGLNPSAARLLDIPEDPLPRPLGDLLTDLESFRSYVSACTGTRAPTPGALSLRATEGRPARLSCRGTPLRVGSSTTAVLLRLQPDGGPIERFRALTEKIDELSGEIHRRRSVEAELREASAAKDSFVASVSHELRTPLNAIIGYTELLERGIPQAIGEEALRQVVRIRLGARHLGELIEEVLSFSRSESGQARVYPKEVRVAELAEEVGAIVEPLATSRGLRLVVSQPDPPPVLETDPGKVRQILLNLLGNAVKFTEEGEVRLVIRKDGDGAVFEVSDTGTGIPAEERERVFEPFWRGYATEHTDGSGLGLSISRRHAELLGGELSVESEPGVGSTFRLRLPAWRNAQPPL